MNDTRCALAPQVPLGTELLRPWLLADIGGTNARFGWVAGDAPDVQHVHTLPTAGHAGLVEAASAYLGRLSASLGSAYQSPHAAAFAVATAVGTDQINFTNNGWSFSREATRQALGLNELLILNDFEALALSLPHLREDQVRRIGPVAPPAQTGAMAVIGPGTGLGVAGIVAAGGGWVAVPGEGGHASLSAADDFEAALLQAVRLDFAHVSAERLLSGIGLPVLHRAVSRVLGRVAPPLLAAEVIVERGLTGQDADCSRTLDVFCALLGSFAGNVALLLGARRGVYVGGGIVPRLGERFFESEFRNRFEAKGRFNDYLRAIPTLLITDTLVALSGTRVALEQRARQLT